MLPIEPGGQWTGAVRLFRDGKPLASTAELEVGGHYLLEVEPVAVRLVDVHVDGDPPIRLRTPLALGVPSGALARSLAAMLGLETAGWSLEVGGALADPHAPLIDALGDGREVHLVR
ncbi:MAG: hypothetical protein H6735_00930 [Alphaproteobacteria bacterium]|nr:hypothetical protein [Alphaproteobacteria bacterium]